MTQEATLLNEAPAAEAEDTNTEEAAPVEGAEAGEGKDDGYKYANKFGSVDELEKGYKELTQKLREKLPEAPEEYKLDLGEIEGLADFKEKLDGLDISEDPMFKAALPAFKKHNLSQDAVNDIIADVLKSDIEGAVDKEAELAKLGDDGDKILSEVARFNAKLPEEEQAFINSIATTAEGVKFAHKLIGLMGEKPVPTEEANAPELDPNEILNEAAKLKRETPNFDLNTKAQARYEALMTEASKIQLKK